MADYMHGYEDRIYRVVITYHRYDGSITSGYKGPYYSLSKAEQQMKAMLNDALRRHVLYDSGWPEPTGHVEVANIKWELI